MTSTRCASSRGRCRGLACGQWRRLRAPLAPRRCAAARRGARGTYTPGKDAWAAAGDDGGAGRELVLADLAFEAELVQRRLHHGYRGCHLLEVDEPEAGVVGGWQEGRGRPAGAAVAVAPGNAAQVDGIEQKRAHIDVLAVRGGGDLLGDLTLGRAGRPPYHAGLAGLDEESEGLGELAGAERVVGGDGVGIGHGGLRSNGCRRRTRTARSAGSPRRGPRSTPGVGVHGAGRRSGGRCSGGQPLFRAAPATTAPARQPTRMRPVQAPERPAGSPSRSCRRSSIQSRPRTFPPS